jgi:hypothetical protein
MMDQWPRRESGHSGGFGPPLLSAYDAEPAGLLLLVLVAGKTPTMFRQLLNELN